MSRQTVHKGKWNQMIFANAIHYFYSYFLSFFFRFLSFLLSVGHTTLFPSLSICLSACVSLSVSISVCLSFCLSLSLFLSLSLSQKRLIWSCVAGYMLPVCVWCVLYCEFYVLQDTPDSVVYFSPSGVQFTETAVGQGLLPLKSLKVALFGWVLLIAVSFSIASLNTFSPVLH